MDIKKYRIVLPGAVTSVSILCGLFAMILALNGENTGGFLTTSCWLVIFAGIIDGIDGKVARMTHSSSEFGIQYDSIADVVTFGAAATVVIYAQMFQSAVEVSKGYYLIPIIFLLCGAIRLARFNTTATTGAKKCFYGLPIPSAASSVMALFLFFYALEHVYHVYSVFGFAITEEFRLRITVFYTLLVSMLMVSTVEYQISSKFFFGSIKKYWFRSLINGLVTLYLIVGYLVYDDAGTAFFAIGVFYIFYHLLYAFLRRVKIAKED